MKQLVIRIISTLFISLIGYAIAIPVMIDEQNRRANVREECWDMGGIYWMNQYSDDVCKDRKTGLVIKTY